MARDTTHAPPEKEWTPESIRVALRKLRRRLTEVEAFDPSTVTRSYDPKATSLETRLRDTLSDVFGNNTSLYRNYELAASLHTSARRLNETPLPVVIQGLMHGKERSISRLKSAIQLFEEKMQDDFPGEPLDQVALSARTAIMSTGSAGIQGAGLQALAGDVRVSIQNDAQADVARFEELTGRVALLEASLSQLRREVNASTPDREIGPGHNRGPDFTPVPIEELDDVDNLIALLKEQSPVPPADPIELTNLSQKASRVSDKIKQYLDEFASEVAKKAGGEFGKRLAQAPIWIAVYHGINQVTEALAVWLTHLPH
jgi:hypothetical protein